MQLVLFIGLPGSGKSTFYKTHFQETHRLISKDLLKNNRRRNRRQMQLLEEAFEAKEPVVLDNTHASRAIREPWIGWAKEKGWKVTAYYLSCSVEECRRRNDARSEKERVPDVGFFTILRELERPCFSEGFDELFFVTQDGCVEEWVEE